ncbi:MAG: hypothetical protein AAFX87_21195 [Bacteroidota bacterium]
MLIVEYNNLGAPLMAKLTIRGYVDWCFLMQSEVFHGPIKRESHEGSPFSFFVGDPETIGDKEFDFDIRVTNRTEKSQTFTIELEFYQGDIRLDEKFYDEWRIEPEESARYLDTMTATAVYAQHTRHGH